MGKVMSANYEDMKRDIIWSVANDYYDQLKNDAPYINMKFEELGAVCRDFATKDVEELLSNISIQSRISELEQLRDEFKLYDWGNYDPLTDINERLAQLKESK